MDQTKKLYPTEEIIQSLCRRDSTLSNLISIVGPLPIRIHEDRYEHLVSSIIGQQLSPLVANRIYQRLVSTVKDLSPEALLSLSDDQFRSVGVSRPKIKYVRDLSQKVSSNEINLNHLDSLSNKQVIKILQSVKGIGQWTSEMFLIFSLGRTDVLSLADVGLQRGCKWLYQLDKKENGQECLLQKAQNWKPYYSFASLYLWEAINRGFVVNFDSIENVKAEL